MADIYTAMSEREDGAAEVVALKCIRPHLETIVQARTMFTHEAHLLSAFDHPAIVRPVDVSAAETEGHFAMELIHGRGLGEIIHRAEKIGLRLPMRLAAAIVIAIADGLQHIHDRIVDRIALDVVHCDVCPANVMIAYDGAIKLVDFGVATSRWRRVDGRVLPHGGTVAYMSPEQCRGEPLGRTSDVYSLGIVLWELMTWQHLYKNLPHEQIIARVARGAVPRPSTFGAEIPAELEDIIMCATHAVPSRRFSNSAAIADALRQLVSAEDPAALEMWMRLLFH